MMRTLTNPMRCCAVAMFFLMLVLAVAGCGAKGDLFLPEDVVNKQKEKREKKKQETSSPTGETSSPAEETSPLAGETSSPAEETSPAQTPATEPIDSQ